MRYHRERVIGGAGVGPGEFSEALRGVAIDDQDYLYAVGDSEVKVFSPQGRLLQSWSTEQPGYCVALAPNGTVYVGQAGQVRLFDPKGTLLDTWRDPQRLGLVSAIGFTGEYVLLADASDRCIRRYDKRGTFVNDIGKDNRMRGFLIPNQHVDFVVDRQGIIHAPNPGKHRVERYTPEGELLGHFGRFDGRDPAGFGGCCNPTNIAMTGNGSIVVTEKAAPRAKVYDGAGGLLAVMGEEEFDPNCKNMDVAVDSKGRIYVVDTARLQICVYAPDESAGATQPARESGNAPVKP